MAEFIPTGWHSVAPRLVVNDPVGLVTFTKHAFDASGEFVMESPSQMSILWKDDFIRVILKSISSGCLRLPVNGKFAADAAIAA